ncbi:progranulin-like isoform X3 [Panulirus ornatus]
MMVWHFTSTMVCLSLLPVLVVSYVVCPGGLVKCPDLMTCCELANKEFGCCPFPSAVCCTDHVHCCPQDMQCDVRHQACLKKGFPVKFFWKVPVQPELIEQIESGTTSEDQHVEEETQKYLEEEFTENKCPDDHRCPGDFTCCKMYSGQYGCCPFHDAKCCLDGFHCCPGGSQCNPKTGACSYVKLNFSLNAYPLKTKMIPEVPRTLTDLRTSDEGLADPGSKCPDGHPCPEKFTCCQMLHSGYGCCPYSEATCCTDLIHCCPKGTTCNTTLGTCDVQKKMRWSLLSRSSMTNKLSEMPGFKAEVEEEHHERLDIVCPDERFQCREGDTCCQMKDGNYGCCPMPDATCCPDHESCCPNGYDCVKNACQRRSASQRDFFLPFFNKLTATRRIQEEGSPSSVVPTDLETVICPDGSSCPNENTCCKISSVQFGCCPLPQATCCGDMMHCCPHGYWCADEGCERSGNDSNVPAFLDKILISRASAEEEQGDPKVLMLS